MKTKKTFFLSVSLCIFCASLFAQNNTILNTSTATPGNNNVIVGADAGLFSITNTSNILYNVMVGAGAGKSLRNTVPTSGWTNTLIGTNSGANITTGSYNTALGWQSLLSNTGTGINNCAIGDSSLMNNSTGNDNTAVGHRTMQANSSGASNTAIGNGALFFNTVGNFNTAIGGSAGVNLSTGSQNVLLGYSAGSGLTTGNYNVFLGAVASPSSGLSNTIILADGQTNQRLYINADGMGVRLGNGVAPVHGLDVRGNAAIGSATFTGSGSGSPANGLIVEGNVGLGTATPGNKVDIAASGIAGVTGLRLSGLSAPNISNGKCLSVNGSGDVIYTDQNSVTAGTNISVSNLTSGYIINASNIYTHDGTINTTTIASATPNTRTVTMDGNNLFFKTRSNSSEVGTSGTGRIYIGNTMTFGGTSLNFPNIALPDSQYRLLVEGGVLTEKVKVALRNSSYWADYVFEADYKLMPLKDVETFVKENKHLPGLSSSEEIVKKGLDLGEMQAKQMEKIEELTLYVIEQNKTLEKQNQEIEALKAQVKILIEKK